MATTEAQLMNVMKKFEVIEVSRLDRCLVIDADVEVDNIVDIIFDNIKAAYGADENNEDEDEDCIYERDEDDLHYVIHTEIDNWVTYEMSKNQYKSLTNYKDPLLVTLDYIEDFGELPDYKGCSKEEKLNKMRGLVAWKILYDIIWSCMRTVEKPTKVNVEDVLEFINLVQ